MFDCGFICGFPSVKRTLTYEAGDVVRASGGGLEIEASARKLFNGFSVILRPCACRNDRLTASGVGVL